MDVNSAKLVLENQTFRFSSPIKFNDPFDTQNNLYPDYELNELPRILMDVMEEFILNDSPLPSTNGPFAKAISIIREKSKNNGYKKSEIEKIISPLLGDYLEVVKFFISEINDHWQQSTKDSRVFCVTEDNDNLLMWAHYAKDHTGVVFQIATLPELDTPLSVAGKVTYEKEPMQFYSLNEIIMFSLFEIELDPAKIQFSGHAYRKSNIWQYEKEWRVLDMCSYSNKADEFVDHKFIPEQLQKIFLGCKFDDANLCTIVDFARRINPSVEILRARKQIHKYELAFEEI